MKKFFLINFSDNGFSNDSLLVKTRNLVVSFLLLLLLSIVVGFVIAESLDYCIINYLHYESILDQISNTQSKYNALFFLPVILIPFFEELLFRLVLRVSKLNLSIFIGFLSYKLLGGKIITFDVYNYYHFLYLLFGLLIGVVSYYCINQKIITFLNQKKKWLIIISIALFGLVHVSNIKILHWQLLLLYPFFVTPQLFLGYFATNLRLKYSFIWGFLLHAMLNGFSYFLSLLLH